MDIYSILRAITQTIHYEYYCCYCVAQIVSALATVFLWHALIIVGFFLCGLFLRTSLLSGPTKYSRVILYVPCQDPESAVFPRNTVSFYYRLVLENKIRALCVLTATKLLLLLGLLSWQSKEICLYTLTHVYIHIYKIFLYRSSTLRYI